MIKGYKRTADVAVALWRIWKSRGGETAPRRSRPPCADIIEAGPHRKATRRCGSIPSGLTAGPRTAWSFPRRTGAGAWPQCDPEFVDALLNAAGQYRGISTTARSSKAVIDTKPNGVILGQRVRGLHRVGIYVPGGTAAYPSSVLMNAIPGQDRRGGGDHYGHPARQGRQARTPTSWRQRPSPGWTGCSSWAARRRWRPWPIGTESVPQGG